MTDQRAHDGAAIPIGPSVPRRGHRLTRAVVTRTMRLFGWRFAGRIPDRSRMVVIGGPHTSNWDLLIAMCVVFGLGLDFHWLGKHTIFRGPFGRLFRWAGGFPVDRRRPGGVVMEVVRRFETDGPFVLALSPEGTRSAVDRWKPGFHRIARAAGVPILPGTIDYRLRVIEFHDPILPTDNIDEDVRRLRSVFDSVTPKRPDRYRVFLNRDA